MNTKKLKKIDKIILYSCIALFCVLSLIIFYYTPGIKAHFEGDSVRYNFIAHNLAHLTDIPLEVLGYPTFLGILYKIWDHIFIIVLAQIILSILSLFLIRSIIKKITSNTSALIASTLFWFLNLGFLIYTQLLLIEIILAFFLLTFINYVITYYQRPSYWTCAQAGFILGISILFRPAALFYALCFPILLLLVTKISLYKRIISSILFLCTFYAPMLAYMTLNYFYFGVFVICPVMNVNLFSFYFPKLQTAFATHNIAPTEITRAIEQDIVQKTTTSTTQVNLIKLCLQQPIIAINIWLINTLKSLIGLYQTQWKLYFELSDHATSYFCLPGNWLSCLAGYIYTGTTKTWLHALGWLELGYLIIEYFAVTIGSWALLINKKYWLLFFALSFILYFAFITGPDGSGRFRMMLEPWLLVLAALGIACLFNSKQKEIA